MTSAAICDTVCQVTQGAEPRFADTPYAQWLKSALEERGWQKKDLAAAVLEADESGRLGESGAEALVRRATHGTIPTAANRMLIERVLGAPPQALPGGLEELVWRFVKDVRELAGRVEALEDQAQGGSQQGGTQ